jgi:3'-phosphoadenosine 5'-phosphosulfate sulfotransferase (PAPS reductase)/FAD synthetase
MIAKQIRVRLSRYDWIVVNSSGGKDSQTGLRKTVKECQVQGVPLSRIVVVHCDLGRVEWEGSMEIAKTQADCYGLRFEVVKRSQRDLLEEVEDRRAKLDAKGKHDQPAWMSSTNRYCTSYYKRDQVKTLWTRLAAETRAEHGKKYRVRILNVMGMRGAESCARSKLIPFRLNDANGVRIVHDWLPIFGLSEQEVWADIKESHVPYHPVYDQGMPRLSCCFCIFAPRNALLKAGHLNTQLLREYVATEQRVRSTFRKELALADVLRDVEAGVQPGPIKTWEMP